MGAWVNSGYLSRRWVDEKWLQREVDTGIVTVGNVPALPLAALPTTAGNIFAGAWANSRYLSTRYVADRWLHRNIVSAGAAITVGNVPALLLAAQPGSALQLVRVNATTRSVPLSVFAAVANAKNHATQANIPGLALAAFPCSVSGGVFQVADITITVEVASTFGYTKVVAAQNAPALPLTAIPAIVTVGADVNVAATMAALPIGVFPVTSRADSSTLAIATVATPLQVFPCAVAVGLRVAVGNTPGLGLGAISAAVAVSDHLNVFATSAAVPLATFAGTAKANATAQIPASLAVPLQAFECEVLVGALIDVLNRPALPVAVLPATVTAVSNIPTHVTATRAALALGTHFVFVQPSGPVVPFRRRVERVSKSNRIDKAGKANRIDKA